MFQMQFIYYLKNFRKNMMKGCYVEAGVFQGAMILNIAEFLKTKKISMKLYGVEINQVFLKTP